MKSPLGDRESRRNNSAGEENIAMNRNSILIIILSVVVVVAEAFFRPSIAACNVLAASSTDVCDSFASRAFSALVNAACMVVHVVAV